jgi:hypothetical protein
MEARSAKKIDGNLFRLVYLTLSELEINASKSQTCELS